MCVCVYKATKMAYILSHDWPSLEGPITYYETMLHEKQAEEAAHHNEISGLAKISLDTSQHLNLGAGQCTCDRKDSDHDLVCQI